MPQFEHPFQLFSFDYPDGWEARYQEESGGLILVHPGTVDAGALSITPVAVTGAPEPIAPLVVENAQRIGSQVAESDVIVTTNGDTVIAYAEGAGATSIPGACLRLWVVRRESLRLNIVHLGPGAALTEQRAQADAAVASLRFPEVLPPTPIEFRTRVIDILAQEYPDLRAETEGEWRLHVRGEKGDPRCSLGLENLYRACLVQSESAGALIRDHLQRLLTNTPRGDAWATFESVRRLIVPVLKPAGWAADLAAESRLPSVEFAPGLIVCFAIDEPQQMVFVQQRQLARWDVPLERVQGAALDNLAERSRDLKLSVLAADPESGDPSAVVLNSNDGYDAARFLLPDLREALAAQLGDEYLVGVPNRDFLIAFSLRRAEQALQIARQVGHDYRRMNYPLTANIYRVHGDRIELWEAAAE